ncbi:uncharacterized protein [Clytia hemisphaerica]|uniref:uncharacterized protein isoform X2 n=1 Tax=Clytia hemisphaerica TaxID=252671 RepID=UPI0034D4B657
MMKYLIAQCLFLIFSFLVLANASLIPGGAHVCHRAVSYNVNQPRRLTRVGYSSYRTCCKRVWGACIRRCRRYRTHQVVYYQNYLIKRYKSEYYCCPGWARSGRQCTIPICNPGCINGKCAQPNVCQCKAGFVGRRCETDVDECSSVKPCKCAVSSPGCSAKCSNTIGSFSCSCNKGFELKYNGQICADVNECERAKARKNKICHHNCINSIGNYYCTCNKGFHLDRDQKTCKDTNECSTLNGGCNQICRNKVGSYGCLCNHGYRLSIANQKTCLDINECLEQKPCDEKHGICTNLLGTFRCSCKTGYYLMPDKKTCRDRDECARISTNGCQQICYNTVGSYTCSCTNGFRLNEDGRKCGDIDECSVKADNCQHFCHNTIGLFTCSCKPGFKLNKDGHTCQALPCVEITSLLNGKVMCSGHVTNDVCKFDCDEGYNLIGSKERTCTHTSTWSGEETVCNAKRCPPFQFPNHGSIIQPCYEKFGAVCVKRCQEGFYQTGESISECKIENGILYWTPDNVTCHENKPCLPNPCFHGTTCYNTKDDKGFICDCSNTSYEGDKCQFIKIKIDSFPEMEINKNTDPIRFYARPDNDITIKLKSDNGAISFDPPVFTISHPANQSTFTMRATKPGRHSIDFEISGSDAVTIRNPTPSSIYVTNKRNINYNLVNVTTNVFQPQCSATTYLTNMRCSSYHSLSLKSICSFYRNGLTSIISKGGFSIPLTPIGINGRHLYGKLEIDPIHQLESYVFNRPQTKCRTCTGETFDSNTIDHLISFGYYPHAVLKILSRVLAIDGFYMTAPQDSSFSPMNLKSVVGHGAKLQRQCPGLKLDNNFVYSIYRPDFPVKLNIIGSELEIVGACLLYNLCQDEVAISLPNAIDVTNVFNTVLPVELVESVNVRSFVSKPANNELVFDADVKINIKRLSLISVGMICIWSEKTLRKVLLENNSPITISTKHSKLNAETRFPILHGKQILMILKDNQGNVSITKKDKESKTSFILEASSSGEFKVDSSVLRLQPSGKINLQQSFYLTSAKPGSIKNLRRLMLWIRAAKSLENRFKTLLSKIRDGTDIIAHHYDKFKHKLQLLSEVLNTPLPHNITKAFECTEQVREATFDLINSLKAISTIEVKLKTLCDRLVRGLQRYQNLNIEMDTPTSGLKEERTSISFMGRFCLHNLCIRDLLIKIDDSSTNDFINIEASPVNAIVKLSSRISIDQDHKLSLKTKKYENKVTGHLNATVRIYDSLTTDVTFQLSEKEAAYQIEDVEFNPGFSFNITGQSNIETVTWGSLMNKIRGQSNDRSVFVSEVQHTFENKASRMNKRSKATKSSLEEKRKRYQETEKALKTFQQKLRFSEKNYNKIQAEYRQAALNLKRSQLSMDQYLKLHPALTQFIEKDLDSICQMQSCQKQCLQMPVCDICQKEVQIPTKVINCQQSVQYLKVQRLKQFTKTCHLRRYVFTTIYTGTCGYPAHHGRQEGHTSALVAIGSAVGWMVGFPLLGPVLGFLGGLFSSCDETYDVITTPFTIQEACTELRSYTTTIKRPYSVCLNKEINVKTGFSLPRQCNCHVRKCIAKMENLECTFKNLECKKNRELYVKSNKKLPGNYTDLWTSILTFKNDIQNLDMVSQQIKLNRDKLKRKVEQRTNMLMKYKQQLKFTEQTMFNMESLFRQEMCISKLFTKYGGDISNIITIEDITFHGNLPILSSIELNVLGREKSTGKEILLPIVYQLSDKVVNIKEAAKSLLKKILCHEGSKRTRRSTNINIPEKVKRANSLCLKLNEALVFLNETTKELTETIRDAIKNKNQRIENNYTESSMENSARKLLLDGISEEIKEFETKQNMSTVTSQLIGNMEIFVSLQNKTRCTSFEDCLEDTFEILEDLPSMMKPGYQDYKLSLPNVKQLFMEIFINQTLADKTLEGQLEAVDKIHRYIHFVSTSVYHCSEPPVITRKSASAEIDIPKGEIKTLYCSSRGVTPVKMFWTKDGSIIDGEDGSGHETKRFRRNQDEVLTLKITTDFQSTGSYKCIVSSDIGDTESNETLVFVYELPVIQTHPSDIYHMVPASRDYIPRFTCNATGRPSPDYQWIYHKNITDPGTTIEGANGDVFNATTVRQQGLYSCIAKNRFGTSQSHKATFNILNGVLANQTLNVQAKVLVSNGLKTFNTNNLNKGGQKFKIEQRSNSIIMHLQSFTKISTSFKDKKQMLVHASEMRRNLSDTAAMFIQALVDGTYGVEVETTSITIESNLTECGAGFKPHSNGFMCVQCAQGTAGVNCTKCPLGFYQPEVGQYSCLRCPNTKTTNRTGAVLSTECFATGTAIVFVVDISRNSKLHTTKNMLLRAHEMLLRTNSTDIKLAVVTFSYQAKTLIDFDASPETFIRTIQRLKKEKLGWRFLHRGIKKGRAMLKKISDDTPNKILIILSNGRVSGTAYRSGFILSRMQSIKAQSEDLYLLPLCLLNVNTDRRTLNSVASHPKHLNVICGKRIEHILVKLNDRIRSIIRRESIKDEIESESRPDIGILIADQRSLIGTHIEIVSNTLTNIHEKLPKSKYAFIQLPNRTRLNRFKRYEKENYENAVKSLTNHVKMSRYTGLKVKPMIQQTLNYLMTEDRNSFSKRKCVIVFTRDWISRLTINSIYRLYDEKIKIINVSFEDKVDKPETELSANGINMSYFDVSDISSIVKCVEAS